MYRYDCHPSPVGTITLASCGDRLMGLWIEKQRFFMDVLKGKDVRQEETAVIRLAKDWLDRYFDRQRPSAEEIPVKWIGSEFQKQVWDLLKDIPYGQVVTYGELAKVLARKRGLASLSAQAVGGAVGRNPISILVPCHRVVGSGGRLTGYSGGLSLKRTLLTLENADLSRLYKKRNNRSCSAHFFFVFRR